MIESFNPTFETFRVDHSGSTGVSARRIHEYFGSKAPFGNFLCHYAKKISMDWKNFPKIETEEGLPDRLLSDEFSWAMLDIILRKGRSWKKRVENKDTLIVEKEDNRTDYTTARKKYKDANLIDWQNTPTITIKELKPFILKTMEGLDLDFDLIDEYMVEAKLGDWHTKVYYCTNDSCQSEDCQEEHTKRLKYLSVSMRAALEGYAEASKIGGLCLTEKGFNYFNKFLTDENSVFEDWKILSNSKIFENEAQENYFKVA